MCTPIYYNFWGPAHKGVIVFILGVIIGRAFCESIDKAGHLLKAASISVCDGAPYKGPLFTQDALREAFDVQRCSEGA